MPSGARPKIKPALQACAVPFRRTQRGLEFCLITTSQGRWSFPKGMIESRETCQEAALKEAFEEAGLHGDVLGDPLGSYRMTKYGKPFHVIGMLMRVTQCDEAWQEEQIRRRQWVTAKKAQQLLNRKSQKALLSEALRRLKP